jgi:hypothetical protein
MTKADRGAQPPPSDAPLSAPACTARSRPKGSAHATTGLALASQAGVLSREEWIEKYSPTQDVESR